VFAAVFFTQTYKKTCIPIGLSIYYHASSIVN
jgi:hypothetical protein